MRKPPTWGDHITLHALSCVLRRPIKVACTEGVTVIGPDVLPDGVLPLWVAYNGIHYDAVLPHTVELITPSFHADPAQRPFTLSPSTCCAASYLSSCGLSFLTCNITSLKRNLFRAARLGDIIGFQERRHTVLSESVLSSKIAAAGYSAVFGKPMPHRNRCRAREASTIWNARPGGVAIAAKSSIPLQLVPVGSDPRRLRLWNGYGSGRLALPVFVFYGFPGAHTATTLCTHARKLCLKVSSLKHASTETFLSSFLRTSICSPKIRIIVELPVCKVVVMLPYPLQTLIQRTFLLTGVQDFGCSFLLKRPLPLRFLNTASWKTRAFPRISLSGLCFRFLALLRCTTSAGGPVVSVWSLMLILVWKPRSRSTPSMNNRPIGIPFGLRVILMSFLDISIISQKPSFANVPVLTRRRMLVVAPILSLLSGQTVALTAH